jgi:hypothetical protein
MSANTRATIEDLYKVDGKAELVNGEVVEMPPAGDGRGEQVLRLRRGFLSMSRAPEAAGHTLMARASM